MMNPEFPNDLLQRLIAIGEGGDFSLLGQLFIDFPPDRFGHLMRQRPEYWYVLADSLPEDQLEALIRAMTVAERDYPWFGGGSVTGTIWAFRRLQERTDRDLDALADWMLAHTKNPWVPYGSSNHGARSVTDLKTLQQTAATVRVERARKENERKAADAVRIGDKATRDLAGAIRRKDIKAVEGLLLRGAHIDVAIHHGKAALAYAQSLGHEPIIALLARQDKRPPTS